MSRDTRALNLRVGVFVTVGLVTALIAIFTLGEKSGVFEGKTKLYVHFADINGLVEGASVRLAGLDVGTVSSIEFSDDLKKREARIALSIKSKYMLHIRQDSAAFVDSKGLLGDKIINITLGTEASAQLVDGASLKTRGSMSMEHLANSLEDAIASVSTLSKTTNTAINELATAQVRGDLGRIVASTANIIEQVERGEGLAHRVLYDPKLGNDVDAILADTHTTMATLHSAIERIDHTVAAIEHGDGMLHELLYGESGKVTMNELRDTATELAAMVRTIREGDGMLHGLIFEPENAKALTEMNQAATRINAIIGEIEKGHGTLGGLVMDPTVYEDLKGVLGNVERNVLLKALIRWTMKEDGMERPATLKVERVPAETPK
jgi:phospholipid/cholesterol/gamma-HCH transport system substrate-binding protein